jgi:hypothetical protein
MATAPSRTPTTPTRVNCSSDDEFFTPPSHTSQASHHSYASSELFLGFSPEKDVVVAEKDDVDMDTSVSSDNEEYESIPPPPTCSEAGKLLQWDDRDDVYLHIQAFAKEHGFAVKKSTLRKGKHGYYTQYYDCCRGGQKINNNKPGPSRKRQGKTLVLDKPCPFSVRALLDTTSKRWHLSIINPSYNHGPVDYTGVFAVHRRIARKAAPNIQSAIQQD